MKQDNKKVIIWLTEVKNLLDGKPIGGIAVQMYFWAKTFAQNGWQVYSFAEDAKDSETREGIIFKPVRNIQRVNFLLEWWRSLKYLLSIRPKVVAYRGANRHLLPLAIFAKLLRVKLVYFSASDVNFEPGKELVGSELNRKLYHRSIRHISYFVTQNQHQHDTLLRNYGKESLTMYNIWGQTPSEGLDESSQCDAVWVANFRKLKRAEWVLNAAGQLPQYKFVLAGGSSGGDKAYYDEMQHKAGELTNVGFLGGRSFFYTNALVARSRVLLCTSTFEGFPNTFLQAWSAGLPVISTVDPSGIIAANGLGEVVNDEAELVAALERVLGDEEYYRKLCSSVTDFFRKNLAAQSGYERLTKYLQI